MPIRQELDPVARVFRTTASGTVTLEDLRRHIAVVRQVRATDYPELIDARETTSVILRSRDLLEVAHLAREALGHERPQPRAVVVEKGEHFAIARTISALVAGWMTLGVFHDVESAERWLAHHLRREAT